ncbi:EAL and HDOD domain-containing protein [Inhella proteolytica]|uniref:HDOD domain-containing protein n=1 Tax=Inhella proteolytica TaxID=2795029 RepID=A0A931NF91_9BURK|nr:HDOD domain-containing protein [Inhella proteolytica]MBH9575851.1 HDOD domain-containing protein [Inhella proteolytica]
MSSTKHPVLAQLALGFAPLYDKQRQVLATRISCIPLKPDAAIDPTALLAAISEAAPDKPVVLNVPQEAALQGLLAQELPANIVLEIPAFLAAGLAGGLEGKKGLLLKGASALGAERAAFKATELDLDDLRRGVQDPNKLPLWCNVVRSGPEAGEAFERGAAAVFGVPVEGHYEAPAGAPAKSEVSADLQVIIVLMGQVDQGESVEKMEATLKRDPGLAFKLLRYMNSAAFGLPVEVTSFRHAMMLLGLNRLKRWLALLLATASKDSTMRPVMWAALRRGLLMEELSKTLQDSDAKDEMFICGLFSLLDHLLKTPVVKLLESIPCPERVRQALVENTGPYQPFMQLVHAIELESVFDYREAAETLMIGPAELNQAVLNCLLKGAQLE